MGLTQQEKDTQAAYTILATQRNKQGYGNAETYREEYSLFSKLCPQGIVLDLGCGSGRDALLITNELQKYIGLDLSLPMLQEAAKLAQNTRFVRGDMYSLPLPDASVGGVWAAASLLHTPRENIGKALNEIHRILKPHGTFFSVMRSGTGEHILKGKEPGTDRFFCFWSLGDWTEMLEKFSFRLTVPMTIREIGGYPWLISFTEK